MVSIEAPTWKTTRHGKGFALILPFFIPLLDNYFLSDETNLICKIFVKLVSSRKKCDLQLLLLNIRDCLKNSFLATLNIGTLQLCCFLECFFKYYNCIS